MKRMVVSCLDQTDPLYVDYLEMYISESKNYEKNYKILNLLRDTEEKLLEFLINCHQNSGSFPSKNLVEMNFPEIKGELDNVQTIPLSDMRVYLFELLDNRVNKYIHDRMNQLNIIVKDKGITREIADEFDKLQRISNRNKARDVDINIDAKSIYAEMKLKPLGLITGIKAIDEKIGGMNPGTVTTIAGFTSQYKCVSENERVYTNKGLLTMKEIYKLGVDSGLMVQSEYGMRRISGVHDEGIKHSYIIRIGGIPIETSPVHRFRVLTENGLEWVEAKDIKVGDKVVQSLKESDHIGEKDNVNFWRLYGQICGDGGVTGNTVYLCGTTENLRYMQAEKLFNMYFRSHSVTVSEGRKEGYKEMSCYRASVDNAYRSEFRDFIGKNAQTKEFPKSLFYKDKNSWKAFIFGLYEADGCSGENLGFTMSNRKFLESLSRLLSCLGISTTLYPTTKDNTAYRLKIFGSKSKNRFNNIIKGARTKVNSVTHYDELRDTTRPFPTNKDFDLYKMTPYTRGDYKVFGNFGNLNKGSSSEKITKICESYQEFNRSEYFREIVDAELSWNEVTSIEESECYMYDLTVEGSPTYVINGYVTHNTTFALNIAHINTFYQAYNIAYISLETPKTDMNWNLLSCHSYESHLSKFNFVSHDRMRKCLMTPDEEDFVFNEVVPDLSSEMYYADGSKGPRGKLVFLDESDFDTFSFGEISAVLEKVDDKLKQEGKQLDAVIVDYIQLCKFSGNGMTRDANAQINSYVTFFRRLGQNFRKEVDPVTGKESVRQLTMILLSQINRDNWRRARNNDGKYDITCLADANELERGSYRVFTTYTNEDLKGRKSAQVQILKNRTGQTMYEPAVCYADGEAYVFCDEDGMNQTFGGNQAMSVEAAFSAFDDSGLSSLGIGF